MYERKEKREKEARELKWYRSSGSSSSSIRHRCSRQLCAHSLNIPEEQWEKNWQNWTGARTGQDTQLVVVREGGQDGYIFRAYFPFCMCVSLPFQPQLLNVCCYRTWVSEWVRESCWEHDWETARAIKFWTESLHRGKKCMRKTFSFCKLMLWIKTGKQVF